MTSGHHRSRVQGMNPIKLDVLGMAVTEIDHPSSVRRGMEMPAGLVVVAVRWGGAADMDGVETGDIISEVDGKATGTLIDLEDVLAAHEARTPVRVLFRRVGAWRCLTIPFEEIVFEEGRDYRSANLL